MHALHDPSSAVGVKVNIGIIGAGKELWDTLPLHEFNAAPVNPNIRYDSQRDI